MEKGHCGPAENREPALRVMAMPKDTNATGDIFGGWILAQVDMAGAMEAFRTARGRVVSVAVKEITLKKPVYVGDLVSCYAEVAKIGNTSITIQVEVWAHRWRNGECVKVADGLVVYVAVDENGNPRPVPQG